MTKRVLVLVVPTTLAVWLLAVSPPVTAFTTRDMLGRDVTLAAPPARIVSLVPSVTEILYALDAEDVLVGVTDFCDFPPDARRKPRVGGMVAPSLEAIVALRPDLVIATTEGTPEAVVTQLTRLKVPVYLVAAHRVADVTAPIVKLGALSGRQAEAGSLVARLERRIESVKKSVLSLGRPRVLYALWPEPLILPGPNALVTQLIQLAGG